MICPVCNKDMFVIEYKRVELDYCHICKGAWFDAGEMELLLEIAGLKEGTQAIHDVLKLPEAQTAETPLPDLRPEHEKSDHRGRERRND